MKTKLLEIRDRMTMIPAIAVQISGADGPLARAAGYGSACVLFGRADGPTMVYDPFHWRDRTMMQAHMWLRDHFDEVETGDVVDVEFLLGETSSPKVAECRG